jgi:acyl-coenzyme A synthetase/AMP-(fatty) acid ligase
MAFGNGETYRSLALNVLRVVDALAASGIEGGQVVGVETPDRYLHLLIVLAAEALSAVSISLVPSELDPAIDLGRLCDQVLVSRPVASADQAKILVMTRSWVANALARPMDDSRLDALERRIAPSTLVRLIKSSGTTGAPKVMRMTHQVQHRVVQMNLINLAPRIARHPDYLCLYNFTIRAAHTRALITLQLGGTIHFTGMDELWDKVLAGTGNYALFVTGDLARFVQAAPPDRGPFDLHIGVMGSAVSRRLRQQTRKITNQLEFSYSSNEVHRISVVDDDNVGTLFPNVRVKIVDECGEPLPLGQSGRICVLSDTMVDGYADAPELTRDAFVNGWFHTSDVGFQPSEGTLVVLGLTDDMLNIGGVKIAPGPIEQRLKAIDGIRDAFVTTIDETFKTGILLVGIEIEDAGSTDRRRLVTRIIGEYSADFRIIALPEFPRTETGKIRLEVVREVYRRRVAGTVLC